MILHTWLQKWRQIPSAVRQFLLRGILLLVIWKVLYLAILAPTRVIDGPLTRIVGELTTNSLNWFTHSKDYRTKDELGKDQDADLNVTWVPQQSVYFHKIKLVGVYDGCNALELFVLYAGFIVCMPASLKKKLIYIGAGTLLIFLVNIFRCAAIAYIIQYYPRQADFAHHFVFVFIVYALIIALWLVFANNIKIKPDGSKQ